VKGAGGARGYHFGRENSAKDNKGLIKLKEVTFAHQNKKVQVKAYTKKDGRKTKKGRNNCDGKENDTAFSRPANSRIGNWGSQCLCGGTGSEGVGQSLEEGLGK